MKIYFNSKNTDKYVAFSNFHLMMFHLPLDDKIYFYAEVAYQAQKCVYEDEKVEIERSATPLHAKRMGKLVTVREDWDEVKDNIMYEIIKAKFSHSGNKELKALLLETIDDELLHLSPWDRYWGVNDNENGENKLGEILMRVRDDFYNEIEEFEDDI